MNIKKIIHSNDSLLIINCFETIPGGVYFKIDDIPNINKKEIPAGTLVIKNIDTNGNIKYYPMNIVGEFIESESKSDIEYKLLKGSGFKLNQELKKGSKITKVTDTDPNFDIISVDKTLGLDYSPGERVYASITDELVGIVLHTVPVLEGEYINASVMVRGTVNYNLLPVKLYEEDKKRLPLIIFHIN